MIMKKLRIEQNTNKGKELWKYNKKGFYNFVSYITNDDIQKIQKKYKDYEIIDKTTIPYRTIQQGKV